MVTLPAWLAALLFVSSIPAALAGAGIYHVARGGRNPVSAAVEGLGSIARTIRGTSGDADGPDAKPRATLPLQRP